jgi:hypothetical protein
MVLRFLHSPVRNAQSDFSQELIGSHLRHHNKSHDQNDKNSSLNCCDYTQECRVHLALPSKCRVELLFAFTLRLDLLPVTRVVIVVPRVTCQFVKHSLDVLPDHDQVR